MKKHQLIVPTILLILAGCNNKTPSYEDQTDLVTPTIISIFSTTITPNTPVIESTLTVEKKGEYFNAMLNDDSTCRFPCWWGLEPGSSTKQEFINWSQNLGLEVTEALPDKKYYLRSEVEALQSTVSLNVQFDNDIVDGVFVTVNGRGDPEAFQSIWKNYSLQNMIIRYGQPTKIRIYVMNYGLTDYSDYHIWVYYEDTDALITYTGAVYSDEILNICPGLGDQNFTLYLRSSASHLAWGDDTVDPLLVDFETATGQPLSKYYESLKEGDDGCFETPRDKWQQ